MPAVCRAGVDRHVCGSLDLEGSPNVFVNGYPVHRKGDSQSHGGIQYESSGTVFANGLGVARIGDYTMGEPPPDGDTPEETGSSNVFAGD